MAKKQGKQTYLMQQCLTVRAWAAVGSKKEGQGPLASGFDLIEPDSTFGQDSWEKAESRMVSLTADKALSNAALTYEDIDCIFAGDLLNQCVGTTFGLRDSGIPLFGLYGACSTMAEGMLLASLLVDSQTVRRAMAVTSSHFCTAERQYRFPLEYGSVRPPSAQWTATASRGGRSGRGKSAALSPRRHRRHRRGFGGDRPEQYGRSDGARRRCDAAALFHRYQYLPGAVRSDRYRRPWGNRLPASCRAASARPGSISNPATPTAGLLIYDRQKQDVHSGGSGCGCSASVLGSYLLPSLRDGKIRNLLFMPTGARFPHHRSAEGVHPRNRPPRLAFA